MNLNYSLFSLLSTILYTHCTGAAEEKEQREREKDKEKDNMSVFSMDKHTYQNQVTLLAQYTAELDQQVLHYMHDILTDVLCSVAQFGSDLLSKILHRAIELNTFITFCDDNKMHQRQRLQIELYKGMTAKLEQQVLQVMKTVLNEYHGFSVCTTLFSLTSSHYDSQLTATALLQVQNRQAAGQYRAEAARTAGAVQRRAHSHRVPCER